MTTVNLAWQGRIALLRLGTGKRRNALGAEAWRAITEALEEVGRTKDVRALIVTGHGSDFSSGIDLTPSDPFVVAMGRAMTGDVQAAHEALNGVHAVLHALATLSVPVVAAIEGVCLGGGLELALACDLRIAAEDARLGFPEVLRGLAPSLGGIARLGRLVGAGRAKALLLTGRQVTGAEAGTLALVDQVAPSGQACAEALSLVRNIQQAGPAAVRAVLSVTRLMDTVPGAVVEAERAAALDVLASGEPLAGVTAFFQKQAPPWS